MPRFSFEFVAFLHFVSIFNFWCCFTCSSDRTDAEDNLEMPELRPVTEVAATQAEDQIYKNPPVLDKKPAVVESRSHHHHHNEEEGGEEASSEEKKKENGSKEEVAVVAAATTTATTDEGETVRKSEPSPASPSPPLSSENGEENENCVTAEKNETTEKVRRAEETRGRECRGSVRVNEWLTFGFCVLSQSNNCHQPEKENEFNSSSSPVHEQADDAVLPTSPASSPLVKEREMETYSCSDRLLQMPPSHAYSQSSSSQSPSSLPSTRSMVSPQPLTPSSTDSHISHDKSPSPLREKVTSFGDTPPIPEPQQPPPSSSTGRNEMSPERKSSTNFREQTELVSALTVAAEETASVKNEQNHGNAEVAADVEKEKVEREPSTPGVETACVPPATITAGTENQNSTMEVS